MTRSNVSLDELISEIYETVVPVSGCENRTLAEACGRVTADHIYSDIDIPPFNKAAMDGYAVAERGLDTYHIIGSIQAGQSSGIALSDNQACEIMTGAPVPSGGVRVIMYEHVSRSGSTISVTTDSKADNICLRGEDVKKGSVIIPAGMLVTPFVTGSLASAGITDVTVLERVDVTVISTGDELVPVDTVPGSGQIRDCNSYSSRAVLGRVPFVTVTNGGIVQDTMADTVASFRRFLESNSRMMLVSGGASRGKYDFVSSALSECGCTLHVDSVRVKPGRPTIFASHGDKVIFGMPGNPVSVLIGMELYVLPALYRMQGLVYYPVEFPALAGTTFFEKTSRSYRLYTGSGNKNNGKLLVQEVEYNGSAHINAYADVSNIMFFPEGKKQIEEGEEVVVRRIW
jgi:molybdopterin molybdotransferase